MLARKPLLRRPWVVPLALLTVIFIAYAVPPYLSLDPAQARIQPMPPHASYPPAGHPHLPRFGSATRGLPSVVAMASHITRRWFIAGVAVSMSPPR